MKGPAEHIKAELIERGSGMCGIERDLDLQHCTQAAQLARTV